MGFKDLTGAGIAHARVDSLFFESAESTASPTPTPTPTPTATPAPTPTPAPAPGSLVLEAEGMALSGYVVDSNNADWIMVGSGSDRGEALASFSAGDGTYSITINAIAENDGRPTLELWVGGTLQATFTYPLATSSNRQPLTFSGPTLSLTAGTEIKLVGFKDVTNLGTAHARVDDVTFALVP